MHWRMVVVEVIASLRALVFFAMGYLLLHHGWGFSEPIASGGAVVFAFGTLHTMFGLRARA